MKETLFSLPAFQQRYFPTAIQWKACHEQLPASCIDCQKHKLADGLLSGRYYHPRPNTATSPATPTPTPDAVMPIFQEGVRPAGFKVLLGKGHEEFSTMRQQDSEEFFDYFIQSVRRQLKKTGSENGADPTEVFRFGTEQRLECGECGKVRYMVEGGDVVSVPVPAKETGKDEEGRPTYEEVASKTCVDQFTGVEGLEYTCPSCQKKVIAKKHVAWSMII